MKRIIFLPALLLAGSLTLSGCAAMLERSHVSSTAHVDYAVENDDESILRAETYQGLVNSLRYFIDEHRSGGVIRLYNYAGDVESDLNAARDDVLQEPVGAFAVGTLNYDSTRILTYYEVKLTISYTRTAREVEAIPEVFGLSGVQQELSRLVVERQKSAVFMASYFSGDGGMMEKLFVEGIYNAPALFCYPAGPEADLEYEISLYPETGTRRIVEVRVNWPDSDREAARRVEELEQAASALLEANPPAGEGYTVEDLAAIIRNVRSREDAPGGEDAPGEEDVQTSNLPLDVLSGEAASEPGLLMAMEYLCHQCGIEAVIAWGEGPQRCWLIVSTPDGYRHLPVDCLYAPVEDPDGEEPGGDPDGEEPESPFALYTDREMTGLGYQWPAQLYPACEEPEPPAEPEPS